MRFSLAVDGLRATTRYSMPSAALTRLLPGSGLTVCRAGRKAGMAPTLSPSEHRRAGLLVVAKRRATGLLVVVAAVFVVSTVLLASRAHWLEWVQATAVASLVGGLADWFAVTALFRRPLGLPIPHTAIVVERKDRFAETLGAFVQESFLTPAAVSERLRASRAVERGWPPGWPTPTTRPTWPAGWRRVWSAPADLLRDEDVHGVLDALVRERVDQVPLAPLPGRTLQQLTREGRHEPADRRRPGRAQPVSRRPRGRPAPPPRASTRRGGCPGPLEDRMVERLLQRTRQVLDDMAADPGSPAAPTTRRRAR